MVKPPTSFMREKWTKLDQYISIALFILHILCIFAPFHFNWRAFWVSFALYVITGLSISVSYHRNLAHKSFELPKLLEYFFAYCAAHALQVWLMNPSLFISVRNLLIFKFFFFRVIQSIGWVHIDVIINLSIQKETHIALFKDFGLVIFFGFLIPILWPNEFVRNILPILKRLNEVSLYGSRSMGDPTTFVIWRSKPSIGLSIRHIFFITLLLQSYSMKLEDFHSLYGAWYIYSSWLAPFFIDMHKILIFYLLEE